VQTYSERVTGAQRTEPHIEHPLTKAPVAGVVQPGLFKDHACDATKPGHARRVIALSPPADDFTAVHGQEHHQGLGAHRGFDEPH
jgi:hypothetical protein